VNADEVPSGVYREGKELSAAELSDVMSGKLAVHLPLVIKLPAGDRLAEYLWTLADGIGNAKIAWRESFTQEERMAADLLVSAFLRLGGQARRGEISDGRG
jgi:hypothetical protein